LLLAFPKITFLKGFTSQGRSTPHGGYLTAQTFAITPTAIADRHLAISNARNSKLAVRQIMDWKMEFGDRCKITGIEKRLTRHGG